jgi:hypothetical protein
VKELSPKIIFLIDSEYGIKLPILYIKRHYQEMKDKPWNGRKYLQMTYLIRAQYAKYIKNSCNATIKKTNKPVKM